MFACVAALSITDIAGIVGAAAGVVAVIAAILVYRWQRERKHLDYELVSGARLLSQQAAKLNNLELRCNDRIVADPYLMLVRFINTGNKPITAQDFAEQVRIQFDVPGDQPTISAELAETSSPDLHPVVFLDIDAVYLEPVLLNPGDWVTMSLLLDGEPPSWRVRGRVVGVTEFREYRQLRPVLRLALLEVAASVLLGLGLPYQRMRPQARQPDDHERHSARQP